MMRALSRTKRRRRILLLSPANASGPRDRFLLGDSGTSLLAQRLRAEGAPLEGVFTFISGLYFRGKLAYARSCRSSAAAARDGRDYGVGSTRFGGPRPQDGRVAELRWNGFGRETDWNLEKAAAIVIGAGPEAFAKPIQHLPPKP